MNKLNILEIIKELKFPLSSYVIVGGAAMAARQLKETHDIDIIVTSKLFERCKQSGEWEEWVTPDNKPALKRGVVEIYLDIGEDKFRPTTEKLIARSEVIGGVRFADLRDVLGFKEEYDKEKHKKDIDLIKNYLSTRHQRPADSC